MRLFIAFVLILLASPVYAAPQYTVNNDGKYRFVASHKAERHTARHSHRAKRHRVARYSRGHRKTAVEPSYGVTFLPHPPGCPRTQFCGCGAAVEIFGRPIRSLWLAANWFKFPRAEPAPGRVAVRRHHVMVLRRHVKGSLWLVSDWNSGGHRSRLHVRDISGLSIVNPHA